MLLRSILATAVLCAALILLLSAAAKSEPIYCYASYYWQGTKTANGERFLPHGKTCATPPAGRGNNSFGRAVPFGTTLRVTNLRNGRATTCRVNDRGPFIAKRCIDLAKGAAAEIGMLDAGVVPVKIEVVR